MMLRMSKKFLIEFILVVLMNISIIGLILYEFRKCPLISILLYITIFVSIVISTVCILAEDYD